MANDERNPKPECPNALSCAVAGFVLRISSFLIRVSELRFMGSPDAFFSAHWDDEPASSGGTARRFSAAFPGMHRMGKRQRTGAVQDLARIFHTPLECAPPRRVRARGLQRLSRNPCRPGPLPRRSACEICGLNRYPPEEERESPLKFIVLMPSLGALILLTSFPTRLSLAAEQDARMVAPPNAVSGRLPSVAPTPAREAAKTLRVLDGFRIDLLAAEPLVASPVAMAYDENGRAYVCEMRDYPYTDKAHHQRNQENPTDAAIGVVRLLEDTDGDGVFDKSTIFADGLSWPTGLACWKGGVFVAATPDIWYLKDTDGDGKADIRRKVFSGFRKRCHPAPRCSFDRAGGFQLEDGSANRDRVQRH